MEYSSDFEKSHSQNNKWVCPTEMLMPFMEVEGKIITRVEGIKSPLSWCQFPDKKI